MIDTPDRIPPENIYLVNPARRRRLLFYESLVPAGFASPTENYIREKLHLDELCVAHPDCTYFVKAVGESITPGYIYAGSMLVAVCNALGRPMRSNVSLIVYGYEPNYCAGGPGDGHTYQK